MWIRLLTLLLISLLAGCASKPEIMRFESSRVSGQQVEGLDDAQRYFLEIALRSEFGDADPLVRRWERPVRVFIDGDKPAVLVKEAYTVIDELKELAPQLDVSWVDSAEQANLLIYFGPYKKYSEKYAPNASNRLRKNWGYFTVQWFASVEGIESATMYVDTHRARNSDERRHLLREELTQVFGLMADSKRYPDSIFYQHWSTTTSYSALDEQLIKMLYDKRVRSGMDEKAVRALWSGTGSNEVSGAGNQPPNH